MVYKAVIHGLGNGAHATARESPGAHAAVHVAHLVMQQNVGRARRHYAERRPDDAAARMRGYDQRVFEVFVQEICNTHGVKAHHVVDRILTQLHRLFAHVHQFEQVPGLEGGRIRRCAQQEFTDDTALPHDVTVKAHGGIRIALAVPCYFPAGNIRVDVTANVVAILGNGHAAAERHDLQPIPGQVHAAVNLGPQQAAHVGSIGINPVLVQFPAGRGAAKVLVFLHHQDIQSCHGEVCAIGQAVVTRTDDDRIIFHGYLLRLVRFCA